MLFRHSTRRYKGEARSWTVCIVEASRALCAHLRLHPREVRVPHEVGADPVVAFDEDPRFGERFQVKAPEPRTARNCLDVRVRGFLLSRAPSLPFPVGIQIRDRRLAAYWAGRNDEERSPADLGALADFTRDLVATLTAE